MIHEFKYRFTSDRYLLERDLDNSGDILDLLESQGNLQHTILISGFDVWKQLQQI